jgi:hypothetical protein
MARFRKCDFGGRLCINSEKIVPNFITNVIVIMFLRISAVIKKKFIPYIRNGPVFSSLRRKN